MAVGPVIERRGSMLSRMVSAVVFRNSRMTANSRLLLMVVVVLVFPAVALAQSTAGRILGTLTDQSGAAVAGAALSVSDVQPELLAP